MLVPALRRWLVFPRRGARLIAHREAEILPVFDLLDDALESVADALDRVGSQDQPQRRIGAMAQLPNQMRRLDGTGRLLIAQPHQHALRMRRRRRGAAIRLAGLLDKEVAVQRQRRREVVPALVPVIGANHGSRSAVRDKVPHVVAAHMPRLHERPLDIETVHLVQHALHQALHRVLRGTVRPQPRHAQRARRRAEDQIPPRPPLAEMRQRQLDHVERAGEIRLELVADLVLVLVLAGADHAVPGAVGDDVDAAEARDGPVDDAFDCFARADVAEQT